MKPLIALLSLLLILGATSKAQTHYLGVPKSEIENATIAHLNTWYPTVIDTVNGGFYTNFEFDWQRSKDQQKMLVTQARDLWTAAKAIPLFTENKVLRAAADHGYQFLTTQIWDKERGGFKMYATNDAPYYFIYGNAFALFALAEYAKINPSPEVLAWVEKSFDWIDSIAHDDEWLGYHNIVPKDKQQASLPENKAKFNNMGWGNIDWKDQNTSIHLLEAFTTMYQVLPLPKVKTRLKEMLDLVGKTMVQPNSSLKLYFTNNWNPIDYSDSTRSFILKNQAYDHISFGHNIETAYLIIDASKVLYGDVDDESLAIAKRLTDHTLKYGFGPNYYGLYDRGYQFSNDGKVEIIQKSTEWWAQYEAWHTLALMHHYFPNENQYTQAFAGMWNYIQTELTDTVYGGCYGSGLDITPKSKKARKAHAWKCPYHDGRALMMVYQYMNE
jgi:mannobiose 2-epimerase